MENFKDKQISMALVDETGAMEMINSPKIRPLLDGARGRLACDKKTLAKALANFSNMIYELGDLIQKIDVDPLKVLANGCVAVDALVIRNN